MYLCIIYGIVIIEICSYNKELYTYKVAYSFSLYCLSMQRLENPKTSIVYHGAPLYKWHPTPRQLKDLFTPSTAIHNTTAKYIIIFNIIIISVLLYKVYTCMFYNKILSL